jgi:transposase
MAATANDVDLYVGIDVSKERLDVFIHPSGEAFNVAQTSDGLDQLAKRLGELNVLLVTIEATGGFEALVVAALAAVGLPVVVVNPRQVHNFAKALGLNAKTDALDASVIARFGAATKPEVRPLPDTQTLALADLLGRRRQIVQMITAEKNRAVRNVANAPLQKSIGRILRALELELARLDDDVDKMVRGSPMWREKEELLASVPGVGKVIARTIMAEMPELGSLTNKQVAALAGVAPWTRQSGQWRGKSMIGGGRSTCRTVLFIAALCAKRCNPDLKAFAERLLNAGKPKMVVIIAIARKLLTILNAILRNGTPWQPKNA